MILPKPFPERHPLSLFGLDERLSECIYFRMQLCAAPFKSQTNGFSQFRAIKVELHGQQSDIIEILHPAVQYA